MEWWRRRGGRVFQRGFYLGALCLPWREAGRVEGPGALERVPELLVGLGVRRPLVVTTRGRWAAAGQTLAQALGARGLTWVVFDGVGSDPTVEQVEAIRARYLDQGCDSLVALGGGSPMDAAKGAAARVVRPRRSVTQLWGLLKVGRRLPPLVAVPTTAGSGSETTMAAVITDEAHRHKAAILDLCLIPRYAVLDPALTLDLPPALTAATGLDALTHAVEAYLCHSWCAGEVRRRAEEATRLIFAHLEGVCARGDDLEGRMALLRASYWAGWAFTRAGVGNVHAIAHALGGAYHIPHGLANGVLLPVVLADYGRAVWPQLARLARAVGLHPPAGEEAGARCFLAALEGLVERLGLPRGFHCIRAGDIPRLARQACAEANPLYPVPVLYDASRFEAVITRVCLPPGGPEGTAKAPPPGP